MSIVERTARPIGTLAWCLLTASVLLLAGCSSDEATGSETDDTGSSETRDVPRSEPSSPDVGSGTDADEPEPDTVTPPARDAGDTSPPPDNDTAWRFDTSDDGEGDGSADGDATPLSISSITPERGSTAGGTEFTLEGQSFTDDTAVYFGSREADVELVGDQLVGETPPADSPGAMTVKVIASTQERDALADGFQYTPELRFESALPDEISTEGGFQITIRGSGFTPETRVSFDGKTALQHEFVDAERLRVLAPPHNPGPVDLRLTNRSETTVAKSALMYVEPLSIEQIRPTSGSRKGGTSVQIRGRGFESNMTVTFGGEPAPVEAVSAGGQRAVVLAPPHPPGLVDVTIQRPDGRTARFERAFYYRPAGDELTVAGVRPQQGESNGGTEVTVIGHGLNDSNLEIIFGGKRASIRNRGVGFAVIETPPHRPEPVDVTVSTGDATSATLSDGFEYVSDLTIDRVTPNAGPASGGTTVEIQGRGFQGTETVEFGGVAAPSFSVTDGGATIRATTPSRAPGAVDVTLERGDIREVADEAFTFEAPLEIYGIEPTRGSIAGGTRVVLRGQGLTGASLDVTFGGQSAQSIRSLDAHTLAVRTPSRPASSVDVQVERGSTTADAPERFTYYNPGSRDGGTWGGDVEGAVNVAVYTSTGQPLPEAFVMLSTNPDTPFQGRTDQNGLITFSGSDLRGPQTVTATAANFSSATIQQVDAENITLSLTRRSPSDPSNPRTGRDAGTSPSDATPVDPPDVQSDTDTSLPDIGGGNPGSGRDAGDSPDDDDVGDDPRRDPPERRRPIFRGSVEGLAKLGFPGPDEVHRAYVYPTSKYRRTRQREPRPDHVVRPRGSYTIETRTGDLALVAIGGIYNTETDEFEPLKMGVKRYQYATRGHEYRRNIKLDIPLDRTLTFKVDNPPFHPKAPNWIQIQPFLDFGFEGYFGRLPEASGRSSLVRASNYPDLEGQLDGVSLTAFGGAYQKRERSQQVQYPASLAIKENITETSGRITMPSLIGVPRVPRSESRGDGSPHFIDFELTGPERPDFFHLQIYDRDNNPVWDAFFPGSMKSLRLPRFPDFSPEPSSRQPEPYPEGEYRLRFIAIRHPTATLDNLSMSDLTLTEWSAYAMYFDTIRFGDP